MILTSQEKLICAVQSNQLDEVKELINAEPGIINTKGKRGLCMLGLALEKNNLDMAKLLIENGIAITDEQSKYNRSSVFRRVVKLGDVELAKLMIHRGANIHERDEDGHSLLDSAVDSNEFEMAKLLIEYGVDVNLQNVIKWSALHSAVNNQNLSIAKLIVSHGANIHLQDKIGKNPLDMARKKGLFNSQSEWIDCFFPTAVMAPLRLKNAPKEVVQNKNADTLIWKNNMVKISQLDKFICNTQEENKQIFLNNYKNHFLWANVPLREKISNKDIDNHEALQGKNLTRHELSSDSK